MDKPFVSVVVPCHNMEPYLAQTLRSVLAQTYKVLEVIVIDDGSRDATESVAREFESHDPRVQVLRQENKGASAARNLGLDHAAGKYVAFIDGDDWWAPSKIEKHVAHLEGRPDLGVSFSATQFVSLDGRPLHCRYPKTRHISDYYLYCRNPITNGSTAVFRREIFDEHRFDESKPRNNDVDCWLRIFFTPPRRWTLEGIDEALTYYRVTPGSLSDVLERHYEACLDTWKKSWKYAPEIAGKYAKLAEAFQLRSYARRAFSMRDARTCRRFMFQAILTEPRIFIYEPVSSLLTLGAALLVPFVPPRANKR